VLVPQRTGLAPGDHVGHEAVPLDQPGLHHRIGSAFTGTDVDVIFRASAIAHSLSGPAALTCDRGCHR